jgi:glucose/arabinose dehydrogenase
MAKSFERFSINNHRQRSLVLNRRYALVATLALVLCVYSDPKAATLPAGFVETEVAMGLTNATAMAFAPDGRLFVCLQNGTLRVIKNGILLPTPFVSLSVNASGERGLLGVTFDPNFATNQFVYVYYTTSSAPIHNRVSRFTANGDVALAGSEVILLDLNNLSGATNHNGGAIHFGPDGKLYIAVGENALPSNAQTLNNLLGKILRINADGSIPADNPFFNTATGNNRAIWALGLRNPYTFAFQPGTSRMFINDVGAGTWEEINPGQAGANYGWPTCEGSCGNLNFVNPHFAYPHNGGSTTGCAITGGAFYNPETNQFPAAYAGAYFFADFCSGFIKRVDPVTAVLTDFATGINSPVDLQVSSDGSLYYLARGNGRVFRIRFTGGTAPTITTHPSHQTVAVGQPVTFTAAASGSGLQFQWQRNNVNIPGATGTSFMIPSTTFGDHGDQVRVVVSNGTGSTISNYGTLSITNGPQLQFSAANYPVDESGNSVTVTVTRTGDTSTSARVRLASADGTANDSSDFTTAISTIAFGPGETSKPLVILVSDDLYDESNETISLTLTDPTGAAIGGQASALVTITDNDSTAPSTNPADLASFFVRQHYADFLHREPDAGGLDYWSNQINLCGTDAQCIHNRRIDVSAAFFVEAEFQNTGFFVVRSYRASLGRRPTFIEFMTDRTRLQDGANLNTEKVAYANDFVQRSEFISLYPLSQTGPQFVDALIARVNSTSGLNLSGKSGELNDEYTAGTNQTDSRARVLIRLIEYPEYRQVEFNPAFVLAQYFGYLRRDPDETGYQFWLNVLNNQVPNNHRAMVCAFLTSTEYQTRFSSVVTRNNNQCGP